MRANPRIFKQAIAAMIAGAVVSFGCDRSKTEPVSTTVSSPDATPAAQPPSPATEPATAPATQPVTSSLLINQVFKQFPGARLRLIVADDHVTAVLYSADPPNAINDDYHGNSFYLPMPLNDVKDLASVNGAQWRYKSLSSDRADNNDGIFLDGLSSHQLQPDDVVVRFEGAGPTVHVRLMGEFRDYDNATPLMPGVLTTVSGELAADVDAGNSQ